MSFHLHTPVAPQDTTQPLRILQISDAHLMKDDSRLFAGINPLASLHAVLEHTKQHLPFDCILSTGDIAQEPTPNTYQQYFNATDQLNIPHFWIRGNHDYLPDFPPSPTGDRGVEVVQVGSWCMILLNSQIENCVYGEISEQQLEILAQLLVNFKQYHTIISLHHHSFAVGSKWLDQHSLKNADDFLKCITPHQQVKLVISGHVHQEFAHRHQHIDFLSCPSTCLQFKPLSTRFSLDQAPPGYRILELYADGQYSTQVHRLEKSIGEVDLQLKEY